jgi:hypothetical protein
MGGANVVSGLHVKSAGVFGGLVYECELGSMCNGISLAWRGLINGCTGLRGVAVRLGIA